MYQTFNLSGVQQSDADERAQSRLNWLISVNESEAIRQRFFRNAHEEEEMLLMRHPIPTQKAFARFGLLLGTFPPVAIFSKLFGTMPGAYFPWNLLPLLFCMLVVCVITGRGLGSKLSRMVIAVERDSWVLMLIESLMIGFIWALATGAAGGFLAYGIGALFGAAFAIPVGTLAFGLFVPLHRLLARGGMIDARHFWPLACGVVTIITALILGM